MSDQAEKGQKARFGKKDGRVCVLRREAEAKRKSVLREEKIGSERVSRAQKERGSLIRSFRFRISYFSPLDNRNSRAVFFVSDVKRLFLPFFAIITDNSALENLYRSEVGYVLRRKKEKSDPSVFAFDRLCDLRRLPEFRKR